LNLSNIVKNVCTAKDESGQRKGQVETSLNSLLCHCFSAKIS
jgi:hypothetical protein